MTPEQLKQIRRYLHQNPELSTMESNTQAFVKQTLNEIGVENVLEVGGTGLAVFFKGEKSGKKILLRGDMDALPIQETNGFEYRSKIDGVSHKCGHDGHTTIMLGVADRLQKEGIERGEVCLIFQPAEENGKGAKAILEDPNFNFKADKAFALHNLPGYPLHKIVCKQGSFTAAAKSVIFKLHGKTSHAAEPERGLNPGLAISRILNLSEELSVKEVELGHFALITMVYVTMGEKSYGVSAGYGEVHLTLRTWRNDVMDTLQKELVHRTQKIAATYGLDLQEEWLEEFDANDNEAEAYKIIKQSAEALNLEFEEKPTPNKWGEDFGLFTKLYKGAMFGVGSGENCPALHNPDYDYPDEITETAVNMFVEILRKAL